MRAGSQHDEASEALDDALDDHLIARYGEPWSHLDGDASTGRANHNLHRNGRFCILLL